MIPPTLLHPGMEMLKVSAKSAQRVKTRKMWLEVGTDDDNGEVELLGRGLGMGEGHDVRICWEKSGRGGSKSSSLGWRRQTADPLDRSHETRSVGRDLSTPRPSLWHLWLALPHLPTPIPTSRTPVAHSHLPRPFDFAISALSALLHPQ